MRKGMRIPIPVSSMLAEGQFHSGLTFGRHRSGCLAHPFHIRSYTQLQVQSPAKPFALSRGISPSMIADDAPSPSPSGPETGPEARNRLLQSSNYGSASMILTGLEAVGAPHAWHACAFRVES